MSPQDLTLPVVRVADPKLGLELYRDLDALVNAIESAPATHCFVDSVGRVYGRAEPLGMIRAAVDLALTRLARDHDAAVAAMVPASAVAAMFRPMIEDRLADLRGADSAGEVPLRMAEDALVPWCRIFRTG